MLSRRHAAIVFVLAGLYLLAMFVATHMPLPSGMAKPGIPSADKLVHAAMYAGLAVLVLAAASIGRPVSPGVAVVLLLLIATYAAVDEWTQQFVPGRSSDPRDWMADVIGASLGAILFLVGRLLWKSKSSTAT
jgi:VanZ family protein